MLDVIGAIVIGAILFHLWLRLCTWIAEKLDRFR